MTASFCERERRYCISLKSCCPQNPAACFKQLVLLNAVGTRYRVNQVTSVDTRKRRQILSLKMRKILRTMKYELIICVHRDYDCSTLLACVDVQSYNWVQVHRCRSDTDAAPQLLLHGSAPRKWFQGHTDVYLYLEYCKAGYFNNWLFRKMTFIHVNCMLAWL